MPSRSDSSGRSRREMLALMGASGVAGVAGCLGDDDGEDPDDTPTETPGGGTSTPTPTPQDTSEIQEGGTLRVAVAENINSFDPPFSLDTTSTLGQSFIWESLTTTGADGTVYPWLAESYEVTDVNEVSAEDYEDYMIPIEDAEDEGAQIVWDLSGDEMVVTTETAGDAVDDGVFGMEFVFTLREGVQFHDGSEMTADDVIASYQRYENSAVDDQTYDSIMHYRKTGDYEVRVYLGLPNPEGIRDATMTVLQEDQANLPDGELDPRDGNEPIGTGPYVFDDFEESSYFVVQKFDDYWLEDMGLEALDWYEGEDDFPAGPVIETIDMDLIPSDPVRQAALQNDEVDFTYGLSSENLNDFEASEDYQVISETAGGYDFIQFPIQVEPWDNEKLREAADHLIPREVIADDIFDGWRVPAWIPLPELARGTGTQDADALMDQLRPRNEYDPELAEQLMEEFVEETGVETPIEIQIETNANADDRVSANELIVESLNQSGWFDASLETYEWGAFLERITPAAYGADPESYAERGHIYYVGLSAGFNPDSYCTANHHPDAVGGCCNANAVYWDDLTELIDEAASGMEVMDDPDHRAGLYDQIWDIITDRDGSVYTVFSTNSAVMNNDVRGFSMHPNVQLIMSYGLHAPHDGVVTWLDQD